MSNQFRTIPEAAEIFKVTPKTIKRWIKAGELRAVHIGGTTRIPQQAIDDLASGAAKNAPDANNAA